MRYRKEYDMGDVFLYRDEPEYQSWNSKEKRWSKSAHAMDAFLGWSECHPVEITKEEAEEIAGVKFED